MRVLLSAASKSRVQTEQPHTEPDRENTSLKHIEDDVFIEENTSLLTRILGSA